MSAARERVRTFIALPLPPQWSTALCQTMGRLAADIPAGVRWVKPAGIHLTLRFLGDTDAALAPAIVAGLERGLTGLTAPELSLSGLGTFPAGRQPRVIWAGVAGQPDELAELHRAAESVAAALGWRPEGRPFRPHLTLGRVRERVSDAQRRGILAAIGKAELPDGMTWKFDTVRLYRSELTPQGAIYSSLGEVMLAGKD